MDDFQAGLEVELAKLRKSYLERLPADLEVLASLAHGLTNPAQRAQLEELHLRLHKLAGSGGTFGLTRMSERAQQLENTARDWMEIGLSSVDEGALKQWKEGVLRLPETLAGAAD